MHSDKNQAGYGGSNDNTDEVDPIPTPALTANSLHKAHKSTPSLDQNFKFPAPPVSVGTIDEAVKDADYVNVVRLPAARRASISMAVTSPIESEYDMVDDVHSEVGSDVDDDQDTISLTSTEHETEGINTPDEEEAGQESADKLAFDFHGSLAAIQARSAATSPTNDEGDKGLVRSMDSDDLETPRQSMFHRLTLSQPSSNKLANTETHSKVNKGSLSYGVGYPSIIGAVLLFVSLAVSLTFSLFPMIAFGQTNRAYDLTSSLNDFGDNPELADILNVTHLTMNAYGQNTSTPKEVTYEAADCSFFMSLPQMSRMWYPTPLTVNAHRGVSQIPINSTKLIDGVYALTLDKKDCHGRVKVDLTMKNPTFNSTLEHNFGTHMIYRQVYQQASTELSTHMAKDVAFMFGMRDTILNEVTAVMLATTSVTRAMFQHAGSGLSDAAMIAAGAVRSTSQAGSKSLSLIADKLARIGRDVSEYNRNLGSRAANNGREKFKRSTKRAQALVSLMGLKTTPKRTKSVTNRKDLSVRMQDGVSNFYSECRKKFVGQPPTSKKSVMSEQEWKNDLRRRIISSRKEQDSKRASNRNDVVDPQAKKAHSPKPTLKTSVKVTKKEGQKKGKGLV
ncbi:hypothetical protein MBLNU230_g0126t1 [Neophaeotheca triangularis]